jgi:hypothetical protein
MTEKDLLNYLDCNYKINQKDNVYEWAEEALEYMDVKLGIKSFKIEILEERIASLAELILSSFRDNKTVDINAFNKAVDALDSLKEE